MSIRIRTGYSFREAAGLLPDVMSRIKEIGLPAAPITDRASAFGWRKWQELAEENEIKPVFGVELAVSETTTSKDGTDHWTFLARDSLEPLHEAIYTATDQSYYEPRLTYDQAQEIEGVSVILGHRTRTDLVSPRDDIAAALSPSLHYGQARRLIESGFQFIAASDNRYIGEEDRPFYEVLAGGNASTQSYRQDILDDETWQRSVLDLGSDTMQAALALRDEWLNASSACMTKGKLIVPERPATLREMCLAGARRVGLDVVNDPAYRERLDRELEIIEAKNFADYFYIIADLIDAANDLGVMVGPARGSSCGSLVCYLLGITKVDPIPYDLIFERFIDINRADLPDIDIDFSDKRRGAVFSYMMKKYGREHVARLGTVAFYQPTSAIKEAAGALNIPPWEVEGVSNAFTDGKNIVRNTLEHTSEGEKLLKEYPEIRVAERLEGHPRHFSQHAAGMIITDKPVTAYVAVDKRKSKEQKDDMQYGDLGASGSTHCDKRDAEALDLLKIDALGLKQLSIFEDALKIADLPRDRLDKPDILTDDAALNIFNERKFVGVFQFDGAAVRNTSSEIRFEGIEDAIAVTSLARPGPLNSGGTQRWIDRKNGNAEIGNDPFAHEAFFPHVSNTLGVVTYQEQIMRIAREVAGMDWPTVSKLRKAVSKSAGKEFMMTEFGEEFIAGCVKNGVPDAIAEQAFDEICESGAYLFNRSHAVAYSIISFQCAWLKAHHPVEYAAAMLTHTDSDDAKLRMLREIKEEMGVSFIPVDAKLSKANEWTAATVDGRRVLVGPLTNVNGIGPKMAAQIDEARRDGKAWPKRAEALVRDGPRALGSLTPISDRYEALVAEGMEPVKESPQYHIMTVGEIKTVGNYYRVGTYGVIQSVKEIDENEEDRVKKRNGRRYEDGKTRAINIWLIDDSGEKIFCKVGRELFDKLWQTEDGKEKLEALLSSRPDKSLWGFVGDVPPRFRMIDIKGLRFLGDLDPNWNIEEGRRWRKGEREADDAKEEE